MTTSWKVELIGTEDETPLDTTTLDGKVYFHAEPGRCFRVKVSNTERDPNIEKFLVDLWIDGESVGYGLSVERFKNTSVMFDGIYKMNKKYHFKFSETQLAHASEINQPAVKKQGTSSSEETNCFAAGSIEVKVYEAVEDTKAEPEVFIPVNKGLPTENKKIDKDKKFWAQPSVTTACADEGRPVTAHAPVTVWKRISAPLFTFLGHYHTPGVIKILGKMNEAPSSSSDIDAEISFTPPLSSAKRPARPARETEVIDLTGDDNDDINRSFSSKKHRRSDQNSPVIIL